MSFEWKWEETFDSINSFITNYHTIFNCDVIMWHVDNSWLQIIYNIYISETFTSASCRLHCKTCVFFVNHWNAPILLVVTFGYCKKVFNRNRIMYYEIVYFCQFLLEILCCYTSLKVDRPCGGKLLKELNVLRPENLPFSG